MTKDILQCISKLECIDVSKMILDVGIDNKLGKRVACMDIDVLWMLVWREMNGPCERVIQMKQMKESNESVPHRQGIEHDREDPSSSLFIVTWMRLTRTRTSLIITAR